MKKAVFLDRDGTIIKERNFVSSPRQVKILSGVPQALRLLKEAGYQLVVFSNQSGIARGLFTINDLNQIHQHIKRLLKKKGGALAGIYYCPHHPEGKISRYRKRCNCRKPEPGMLRKAARDLGINLKESVVIGDSLRDLQAGKKVGTRTILVLTGKGRITQREIGKFRLRIVDHIAPNLLAAVRWIKR